MTALDLLYYNKSQLLIEQKNHQKSGNYSIFTKFSLFIY